MKKGDIIIFITILLAGLSLWVLGKFCMKDNTSVIAEIDGNIVVSVPLGENTTIDLTPYGAENILVIENKEVYVREASCDNQVCVKTGKIKSQGQIICCLPHKLVIYISGSKGGYDAETY